MKTDIQSPHFNPDKELIDFVTDKVGKLHHFYEKILAADVCLKLDHADNKENKICEIRLVVPGDDLFAQRQCKTFEEATMETLEALRKQIEKKKKNQKRITPNLN